MRRRVVIGNAFELKAAVSSESDAVAKAKEKTEPRAIVTGREWDLEARAYERRVDALTRARLVAVVSLIGVVVLGGAGIIGTLKEDYGALAGAWAVFGPIYGSIATYYFSSRPRK